MTTRCLMLMNLMAISTLTGCLTTVKTTDEDIRVIDITEVVERMNVEKKDTLLVDVRIPRKFQESHIPGAVNIPVREIYPGDERLDRADTIITYGDDWHDPLSRAAAKTIIRSGYSAEVLEFKGGIELWKDDGRGLMGAGSDTGGRPETGG